MITQSELKEILSYDPETGIFIWRVRRAQRAPAGSIAGWSGTDGYHRMRIDGKQVLAHRLAWLYMTGSFPADCIDHIDGEPSNNVFANLRAATRTENMRNSRTRSDNSTGYKGVTRNTRGKAYRAQIRINGVSTILGNFDDPKEAHAAYCKAADEHFGKFSRHS